MDRKMWIYNSYIDKNGNTQYTREKVIVKDVNSISGWALLGRCITPIVLYIIGSTLSTTIPNSPSLMGFYFIFSCIIYIFIHFITATGGKRND